MLMNTLLSLLFFLPGNSWTTLFPSCNYLYSFFKFFVVFVVLFCFVLFFNVSELQILI